MESLQALAETNMQISEAKALLSQIREDEVSYLAEREKKALARIQKIHDESEEIARKTKENYAEVHEICVLASGMVGFVHESHRQLSELAQTLEEKSVEWEKQEEKVLADLAETKKLLYADRIKVQNERKGLENAKKAFAKDVKKLQDDRGTLERAIKRIKEGRI